MPFLGGLRITSIRWLAATTIAVTFTTTYGTDYVYQLYAGRTLIGSTAAGAERQIVTFLQPADWPEELTLLAVDPAARLYDYGALLPDRPYNRIKVQFTTTGWAAEEATRIELAAGDAPGEAVDLDHVVAREFFDTDRLYTLFTRPMPGSGEWALAVSGRDETTPAGNLGDPLELSADVLAHPPDVHLAGDGTRVELATETPGVLTVDFSY